MFQRFKILLFFRLFRNIFQGFRFKHILIYFQGFVLGTVQVEGF